MYTAESSPLIQLDAERLHTIQENVLALRHRLAHGSQQDPSPLTDDDVRYICRLYFEEATPVGIDPVIAISQMVHETAALTSYWSQPPRRNPAGIGVTGEPDKGVSFPDWRSAIRAHAGRLLAYATKDPRSLPQAGQLIIAEAVHWRSLPAGLYGTVHKLSDLDGHWAVPGEGYGARIANTANALLTPPPPPAQQPTPSVLQSPTPQTDPWTASEEKK